MKRFVWGTCLFLAALILWSSLATYPIWCGLEAYWPGELNFRRVFNRVLMIGTFLLLIPLAKYWGVKTWSAMGMRWPKGVGRDMALSFLAGVLLVAALALWSALFGHRIWKVDLVFSKLLGYLASGWSIGFFEEVIFRGFFFLAVLGFTPRASWPWVAVLGSAVFAGVHFFIDIHASTGAAQWGSGWAMWEQLGACFLSPERILTRWLSLFMAALVLCTTAWKQGHIWAAVSLHAGWVFAIKTVHKLSDFTGSENLWFKNDLLSGLWASVMLAAYLLWLWRRKEKLHEPLAGSSS